MASNMTFELITSLLNEMTGGQTSTPGKPSGLFPENMIHLGGDEVNTACWGEVGCTVRTVVLNSSSGLQDRRTRRRNPHVC